MGAQNFNFAFVRENSYYFSAS